MSTNQLELVENNQFKSKQRIEYIDLMKGFCIILVVYYHCVFSFFVEGIDLALKNFRMPLYFFLSGLFFKKYNGFTDFVVRKSNKLVLPYLFFSIIPFCLLAPLFSTHYMSHVINSDYHSFMFCVNSLLSTYNMPLWFLRSLFMTYILYYGFKTLTEKRSQLFQIITLIVITILVWLITFYLQDPQFLAIQENIRLFITSTLVVPFMVLPFMYVAEWVRKTNLLNKQLTVKQEIILLIISIAFMIGFAQPNVLFINAQFGRIYPFMFISAFSGITALALICKRINRLPYFSYLGRYSLIVLGTHWPFILVLRAMQVRVSLQLLIIFAIMPITIWIFKTLFPYFTAQKDLIKFSKHQK